LSVVGGQGSEGKRGDLTSAIAVGLWRDKSNIERPMLNVEVKRKRFEQEETEGTEGRGEHRTFNVQL
jgi:hypothetical protein